MPLHRQKPSNGIFLSLLHPAQWWSLICGGTFILTVHLICMHRKQYHYFSTAD